MASSNEYQQLLIDAFNGERLGVALSRELADCADDSQERAVYLAFEQVEALACAQLEPMLLTAGLTSQALSEEVAARQGVDLGRDMTHKPRTEAWTAMLPEFEKFIDHLERLRDLAPSDDLEACNILVEHEVASVAMVKAIINNDLDLAQNHLRGFLAATKAEPPSLTPETTTGTAAPEALRRSETEQRF